MFNLKNVAIAIVGLSSSIGFAGTMGPVCTPGKVTVPCESRAWDVGIYALYMQTMTGSGWHYYNSDQATPTEHLLGLNNDWNWGFELQGSYHFNTGNDLTLSWLHIDQDHLGSFARPFVVGAFQSTINQYQVSNNWNQVNLEFGQFVDFSANKKMRFHGGASYSSIDRTVGLYSTSNLFITSDNSQFDGVGPRTGLDMMYQFGNGYSVYAKAAVSLLFGTSQFTSASQSLFNPSAQLKGSKDALASEFEGKLGVASTYHLAAGDATIDLGWKWVDYVNAFHNRAFFSSSSITSRQLFETSYALQGLEFGAHFVGNM